MTVEGTRPSDRGIDPGWQTNSGLARARTLVKRGARNKTVAI